MSETGTDLHEVVWTATKIARFWNQYAGIADREDAYFSKTIGPALLRLVRRHGVSLEGSILDFGCGPGHLLELLAEYNGGYQGVDFSSVSVDAARKRLMGRRGFAGVASIETLPTHIEDARFDLVFLIETIEHLLPDQRDATLREISRLLRRGGKLVVTVPNDENLAASKVSCPDCGCVFHRVQHVSSWSASSLSSVLAQHGFQTLVCRGTRLASAGFVGAAANWARLLLKTARPNLVWIGQRI